MIEERMKKLLFIFYASILQYKLQTTFSLSVSLHFQFVSAKEFNCISLSLYFWLKMAEGADGVCVFSQSVETNMFIFIAGWGFPSETDIDDTMSDGSMYDPCDLHASSWAFSPVGARTETAR